VAEFGKVGPAREQTVWRVTLAQTRGMGFRATAAAMSVVAVLSGCATSSEPDARETVIIAADLELSGDGAALGTIFRNALDLRVEQINRRGLLRGRDLELVVRDNRTDSATAAANLLELASDPSVTAIITGACAACVVEAAETINGVGVPTISLAAPGAVSAPVDDRRYIFKLGPNAADTASALTQELGRAGIETLAVVATDDAYGDEGLREVIDSANRSQIEVVVQSQLAPEEDSLTPVVNEILEYSPEPPAFPVTPPEPGGPDAVVVWGYAPFGSQFAVRLRDSGYEGPLYLDPGAADELFLTGSAGAALSGATMIFTETMVIDEVIATSPAKAARKTWFNDYSARYGTYHGFASFAADAVQLIVEAVNQVDGIDREQVRAAIESMQFDGLTGPLRITPENHSGLLPQGLAILVARGDRWRLAG
jgi:branched-chain amino acid transport system substrate-binding protein